jgi:HlyD family secretion protein
LNQLGEKVRNKINRKYLIIMGIAVLIIIAWIIYISQFNHQKAEATWETETVELTRGNIRETISGSGTIEAISRKEIASECTGTINTIYVSEGQEVEKGDLLMTFDNDSYDSSVKSAELNLQQAKAELASLNRDKANLKIYAPSSGMLGSSLPAVGDNLGKGAAFSAITDKTHMQVQASFNLNSSSSISKGQKASLFIADYLQSIEGTVANVSSVEYQGGQKISNVLISIANPGRLVEGTGVTVSIQTPEGTFSAAEDAALRWPSASTAHFLQK